MGKTRCIEKKQKSHTVSEEREQNKIKEGIFKAFQARLSSPGQGGALLVAEPRHSDVRKKKNVRQAKNTRTATQYCRESDYLSSDSMSDDRQRSKTRKTKFTKKKNPAKSVQTRNKRQMAEVDTAVSKHMRIAHGITGQSTTMKDNSMINYNFISRNRVSQKVGLINTGKKGAPASKALIIPEYISKQVDAGVKKLVQEAEADIQCCGDLDIAETMVLSKSRSVSSNRNTPNSAKVKTVRSVSAESMKHSVSPDVVKQNIFPEELPLKETILQLLSSLKSSTKHFYPRRNYLRETQDNLLKLFKQNSPRSSTCTRTPVSLNITKSGSFKRSLIDLFDSQRSELPQIKIDHSPQKQHCNHQSFDNYHPVKHTSCHDDLHGVMTKHSHCDRVLNSLSHFRGKHDRDRQEERSRQILEEIRAFIDSGKHVANMNRSDGKRMKQDSNKEINLSLKTRNNYFNDNENNQKANVGDGILAKKRHHPVCKGEDLQLKPNYEHLDEMKFSDMFEEKSFANDFFLSSNKPTRDNVMNSPVLMWVNSAPQAETCGTLAGGLLQENEVKKMFPEVEPMDIEVRNVDAVNLLERNDIYLMERNDMMEMSTDNKPSNIIDLVSYDESLDEMGRHSRCHSQCSYSSQESSHRSGIIQKSVQRQVHYMPSIHDNYYMDHMGTGDLGWEQKAQQSKVEAMDILDYVDQQVYKESKVDARGDRMVEIHPGFNNFQESKHNGETLRKNSLLPPSPMSPGGPKFYPKKMY